MNPSDLEFEQRLKRLQPASCESLASDTFYEAGWSAALQSIKNQKHQPTTTRRHATSFAAGLTCGLVMIAGLWQFSHRQPEPTDVGSTIGEAKAPEAVEISSAELTIKHQPQRAATANAASPPTPDLFDEYSLPATLIALDQANFATHETRVLSPVARRSWSKLLSAEPRYWGAETSNTANSTPTLRTFPATREVLESLL